jgi:hypothetical protein
VVLATLFIRIVRKKTSNKLYRQLAVAFVILLPSWDVLLGFIVYYPACLFVPKTAIYETAETEGIYYEGDVNNFLIDLSERNHMLVRFADIDFDKGFKFVESLITEIGDDLKKKRIPPTIYRCEPFPRGPNTAHHIPIDCKPTNSVQSDYMVKTTTIVIGRAGIGIVKVYNRRTNKLMAEYREVERASSTSLLGLPFFNWLKLWDGSPKIYSCPENSRFNNFQFDVLKPKR